MGARLSFNGLLVRKNGKSVLSKLNISIEVVQALVVGSVLSLSVGSSHGEDIGITLARDLFTASLKRERISLIIIVHV